MPTCAITLLPTPAHPPGRHAMPTPARPPGRPAMPPGFGASWRVRCPAATPAQHCPCAQHGTPVTAPQPGCGIQNTSGEEEWEALLGRAPWTRDARRSNLQRSRQLLTRVQRPDE
eukprot:364700-Chlamydomonas_euryale.AAC.4